MGSLQEGSWALGGGGQNLAGSWTCLRHRIKCAGHAGTVWPGCSRGR